MGLIDRIEPVEPPPSKTLKAFLAEFLTKNCEGKKPATLIVWGQVIKCLNEYMPEGIALNAVTAGHAIGFANHLKAQKLAQSTIYKRVGFARQFFGFAVNWELIEKNPFDAKEIKAKVRKPSSKTKSNVEVPLATINTVLAACDPIWKGIIGLSRFGGLRCPSEVLTLKWGNVDFETSRMTFVAPKNEGHDDEGIRTCPLFTELRPILQNLYDLATVEGVRPDPATFVIAKPGYRAAANTERGWANANLRTQFLKILARAQVEPWKRIFHSMRASRQTELEAHYPLHVVCRWLGNTEEVARESYLLTSEQHFDAATGNVKSNAVEEESNAKATQIATSYPSAPASVLPQIVRENVDETPFPLDNSQFNQWRRGELNPYQFSRDSKDTSSRGTNPTRADSLPKIEAGEAVAIADGHSLENVSRLIALCRHAVESLIDATPREDAYTLETLSPVLCDLRAAQSAIAGL